MDNNRDKYLIKNTIIFTLGNLGSKLISFFLVPLYTNELTAGEYGVVDLIATVGTVAVPILTLNICEAVMRFALDENADKAKITKIGTRILLIGIFLGFVLLPTCYSFDKISEYSLYIYFYVVSSAASQLYLYDLRGKEFLIFYSAGNVLHTFLIALLNVTFLLVFKLGIVGYLLAYIFANTFTALYALIVGKGYRSFFPSHIDVALFRKMVKYSIVLVPNSFMWWIMNSSDRIMVSSMVGMAANGIYAISYRLPTLISTLTAIFNQAWSYSAIHEEGTRDEGEYNNKVFKSLTGIVMFLGICLLTFAKPFLKFYVAEEYYDAWKYIPFLTVGCVYLTLSTFIGTSYTVHKDSFGYLFSGIFGAIFNILMNFLLIPVVSVYGAALSTCVSYILVFAFRLFHTRKYIKYNIINRYFFIGTSILFLSAITMYYNTLKGFLLQCILFILAFWLFRHTLSELIRAVMLNTIFKRK